MNIVWKNADGTICETVITQEGLDLMSYASSDVVKNAVSKRADLAADHDATETLIENKKKELETDLAELNQLSAEEPDDDDAKEKRAAAVDDLSQKMTATMNEIRDLDAKLESIRIGLGHVAAHDEIALNVGRSIEEHAAILKVRTGTDALGNSVPSIHANSEAVAFGVEVPETGVWFDALMWDGKKLKVDMARAKEVARNVIRAERPAKLAHLDVTYMRALEQGKDTSAIVAAKQKLRDAPNDPAIASAKTTEALDAILADFGTI